MGGLERMRAWTRESVAEAIERRFGAGCSLSYTATEREDSRLLCAACYYYGTWKAAVEAAGIGYAVVRKYRSWSREAIVSRIRQLYAAGHDLSWTHVSRHADPRMAASAVKPSRFGSWRAAVEAAGFDYARVARYRRWTPERVIQELRNLARSGQPLNSKAVQTRYCALFTAGRRRFGSWNDTLSAAGLYGDGSHGPPAG